MRNSNSNGKKKGNQVVSIKWKNIKKNKNWRNEKRREEEEKRDNFWSQM